MAEQCNYFPLLVGNESIKARFACDIAEGHLSHAYIIEGPRGTGKHTFSKQVAAAIECKSHAELSSGQIKPCGHCPSCEKILADKSPDVKVIGLEDDRSTIGVDAIRDLKNDMYTAPNDLSIKVYIIEDADLMTEQAQNAFLLSLEEPPEYILFFLLCESSTKLLETVRSRAPTLRTQRLDGSLIDFLVPTLDTRACAMKEENIEEWETLVFVANGSVGYALELLEPSARKKIFENRRDAKKLISLLSGNDKKSAMEALMSFGKTRADVSKKISFLQYAIRDLILLKKHEGASLCFFENSEAALELSTRFTSEKLLSLYDATVKARDDLDANANVKLTLLYMMQSAGLL